MNNGKKLKINNLNNLPSLSKKNIFIKENKSLKFKINPDIIDNSQKNYNIKNKKFKNIKYRCNSQPKLFSLIDIKDIYHSKGTNLPNQYKRKIYNNINKLLYSKNDDLKKIPQIEYDNININKNNKNKIKRNKSQNNLNIDDYRIQSALISRKERLYKPYYWDNYNIKDIKKKQRDNLMPEGYEFYEKNIMNYKDTYYKNNYIQTNKPVLIRKYNQYKQNESDIFFLKEKKSIKNGVGISPIIENGDSFSYNKEINEKNKINNNNNNNNLNKCIYNYNKYNYNDSDIFNLRKDKDENINKKSGEYTYFRKLKNNNENNKTYNVSNQSEIGWGLRGSLPSYVNYTSTKYNLLNRNIKNIGNTKEDIINESKKISDNYNPINKKKGLCEFMDISQVTAPKINNDYNKAINDNPNIFKRKNDISSEYYDIYNKYNNICDKPFQKFNLLKSN